MRNDPECFCCSEATVTVVSPSSKPSLSDPPSQRSEPCRAERKGRRFSAYRCSVIVPARNEAGNIQALVERIPDLGVSTEIVIVEGHSHDHTWKEVQRAKGRYPDKSIKAIQQRGTGKADAVREGIAQAEGELLFILDSDLTVAPEDLVHFYYVIAQGRADFANGVRTFYPMEPGAMFPCNRLGNWFFALALSCLMGQRVHDALCGTKVFFKEHYARIEQTRPKGEDFDPFGDFDLLLGAARLHLRIVDVPVHYQARTYGSSNIRRWRDGWKLLRIVLRAAARRILERQL